jgi:hypothetical protein
MHPDDRVLVAVMSRPKDFAIARDLGWYRLPEDRAPRAAAFEYVAFYFTAAFGDQAWAVHYYAPRLGHELVTRRDLLPDEPDHPRAGERYLKLQLGSLERREPPILSLRWRRISFIHTTWDRFQAATEINDLFAEGGEFVDRLYHALREAGLNPERCYPVREAGVDYVVDLAVPCQAALLAISVSSPDRGASFPADLDLSPERLAADMPGCLHTVHAEVERRGGLRPLFPRGEHPGNPEKPVNPVCRPESP